MKIDELDPNGDGGLICSTEAKIRVAIVDDHAMVAEGLGSVLSRESDLEFVGSAGSVASALLLVEFENPAVVLMDYRLPDGDGVSATEAILRRWPDIKVVLISGSGDVDLLARSIEAGCVGFLNKISPWNEVSRAVRCAFRGESVMSSADFSKLMFQWKGTPNRQARWLTKRELEILGLLGKGTSTETIAGELFLSVHTVRNHVSNILRKLGAHSKLEAVAIAARDHVISRDKIG